MQNDVAATILNQLGGNPFIAMTGAKDFVKSDDSLSFFLPARFARNGINRVCIRLLPSDVYAIEFYQWRPRKLDLKLISEVDHVGVENLREVFTQTTGLHVSL